MQEILIIVGSETDGLEKTILIIPTQEIKNIMKIIKSPKDSGLLTIWVTSGTGNEKKEQRDEFFGLIIPTLGVSTLKNMLPVKGAMRAWNGII